MKITRVQYTVRSDFVAENQRNIEAVMSELRTRGDNDVRYAAYLHDDGKTFMHLVHYNTAAAEHLPASLEAFRHFRARLKDHLEAPPKSETFGLVQSSVPMFA
jgi:hypothetical protein